MALWSRKRSRPKRPEGAAKAVSNASRRYSTNRNKRGRAENGPTWFDRLKSPQTLKQLAILVGFFVAVMLIVQLPRQPLPVRRGETITHPITARVDFEYVDEKATGVAQELAADRVPGVYRPTEQPITALRENLLALVDAVREAASVEDLDEARQSIWKIDAKMFEALTESLGPDGENLPAVQEAVQQAMEALAKPDNLAILGEPDRQRENERGKKTRDAYAKLPVGLLPDELKPLQDHEVTILVSLPEGGEELRLQSVLTQVQTGLIRDRIAPLVERPLDQVFGRGSGRHLAGTMASIIGPTLVYQEAPTEGRRQDARGQILPIRIPWRENATLLKAGTEITDEHLRLLKQEAEVYQAELGWWRKALAWMGAAGVVGLVILLQAGYTWRFQPRVARSAPRSLILGILCLVVLGASKAVAQANWPLAFCVFFLTTAAMIVTIAYSQRFALALTGATVLLVAIAIRSDLDWVLMSLAGTGAAVLTLGEINNRSKLINVGAVSGLTFFLVTGGLALWRYQYSLAAFWPTSFMYFGGGLAAGFLMLGLLPFIERAFGIVTNISLLELCDVNQPALKRLAIEAPGTYQHSLLIGTLAEAAAKAIGAGGLLARVGAYFHDIGKVNKPRYFVENWQEEGQTHSGLKPAMSRLVITSHVKDGLEMADRLGLPPLIKNFIAEHHGTALVEYFFREAERTQTAGGGEAPSEDDFRYPGPKPRSPETAVVMLADAVEGATRSLKEPNASRLKATVHEMVMKRLLDGQLDESGLTLSDLQRIEEALTKTLLSVYHGRVPYPSDRPEDEAAGERPEAKSGEAEEPERSGTDETRPAPGKPGGHDVVDGG